MNRLIVLAAVTALMSGAAAAQEADETEIPEDSAAQETDETQAPEDAAQETDDPQDPGEVVVEQQEREEIRGDWVIGARVMSPTDERIGAIEDLIINMDEGTVRAAVVSVGGFLGFGAKNIAVNWQRLDINYDGNEVRLDLTRDEAEEAEEYIFRDREDPPAPEMDTGGDGMGTDTGGELQ